MRLLTKRLFIFLCLLPLQSFGHSKLISSQPANQAELTEIPRHVVLNFNKEARLLKVELRSLAQEVVEIDIKPALEKSSTFEVALPTLEANTYQVNWVAMSGDSHQIEGEFRFSINATAVVLPVINIFKNAGCSCCNAWVSHLQQNGFTVQAHNVGNMYEHKVRAKLGAGMGSCHTAFVDDYAVEGHVPAEDLKRMLLERPDISGLTVPGMPVGSPGMEMPGRLADPFQVISYKDGKTVGVFSDYPAGAVFE